MAPALPTLKGPAPVLGSPLMAAPAAASAPFAPAVAATPIARPATNDIEWPQARSKKPLIIGAIGVCAVIVVAWLLLSGPDEPALPPASETPTQPASPPAAPAPEPPPPEPTPAPASPPPEPPTPAGKSEPPAATPVAPPRPQSTGSGKGGFADLFEQGAKGAH